MNKGHVTELLADYIDGLLAPEQSAAVKEHLARCAECREELGFLKAYKKEASVFPAVPVPDDFLEKIHARIDAPSPRGLLRALFFPLKLKLPLEAAGALALTLLAVFIFKPLGERVIERHAEAPVASEETAAPREGHLDSAGAQSAERLALEDGQARRKKAAAAEEKAAAPDTARITVANGIEEARPASDRPAKEEAADMSIVLVAARTGATGTSGALKRKDSRTDMITSFQKGAYDADRESAEEMTRAAEPPSGNQTGVDIILNRARALGGRVIRVGGNEESGARRLVIVEIPAHNYSLFITGIRSAWSVRDQSPGAPPARAGLLRITMSLTD